MVERRKVYELFQKPLYGPIHKPLLSNVVTEYEYGDENVHVDTEYEHVDTDPEAYGPYERDYTDDDPEDSLEIEEVWFSLPRRAG